MMVSIISGSKNRDTKKDKRQIISRPQGVHQQGKAKQTLLYIMDYTIQTSGGGSEYFCLKQVLYQSI